MEREKSFDEARTAVQSQIEKIFQKTAGGEADTSPLRRYKMHGISHIAPDDSNSAPPPTHGQGIHHAISTHPLARWREEPSPPSSHHTNLSPLLSRHDSIESLDQSRFDTLSRLSHHSSMFSLASPAPYRTPSSHSQLTIFGSQDPSKPQLPLRQSKPSSATSMMDLEAKPFHLSPLDRSSSQLSLIYGARQEGSMLDQARRISSGASATPSPPSRLARHHSQLSPAPFAGRMQRTQSHLSVSRDGISRWSDRQEISQGSEHLDVFLDSVGRINNNTEFRLR